ncbi:hypothetical protein CLOACE_16100 [Clostridium acetireducens DSM 10703]|jgi:hypothetical protein|uniref:Uncharacterized protein n=1 Tax=Clostridium acetireducens DSM 10703 TaxID=1121290 RepID=A0A1E8EXJ4_9CLOT|nr:hypothetical protein [Clostridium acetireducens]OFI05527.1 hypothetical protein CLOACE_16100 [Clostridium acetireducens DSM 10703]
MDENSIRKVADILSAYSYKVDAMINLLVEKEAISKDEVNDMLNKVMDEEKKDPNTDEYVIEGLKDKVLLK